MFPECCPYSKILSTFVSVEQSTDIMKVFSHCPFKKMWKFSMPEGQRTALIHSFRLCFRGILCPSLRISIRVWSIGYVYFWHRSFHNLLEDRRNQLHTFFFY